MAILMQGMYNLKLWRIIQISKVSARSGRIWFASNICYRSLHRITRSLRIVIGQLNIHDCIYGFMLAQKLSGENFNNLYISLANSLSLKQRKYVIVRKVTDENLSFFSSRNWKLLNYIKLPIYFSMYKIFII